MVSLSLRLLAMAPTEVFRVLRLIPGRISLDDNELGK
jgi:hypothetical protein